MASVHNLIRPRKSRSEEYCKNCLDSYLRDSLRNSIISWNSVERKNEPPDYFLFIDGEKYAVEITTLVETVDVGTKEPLPVGKIQEELIKFVREQVESVASAGDFLRGTYLVTFSKPIENFTSVKNMIQGGLLSYIRSTLSSDDFPVQLVYQYGRQTCKIRKVHGGEDRVHIGGPGDSKREIEILADAHQLLTTCIQDKIHKLRNISVPKVLLLHNKDILCSVEAYRTCIRSIPSCKLFHSVFVVDNGKTVPLYVSDPKLVSAFSANQRKRGRC